MTEAPRRPWRIWTEAMKADLLRLSADGATPEAMAAYLNERHGTSFNARAVACKRSAIRPDKRIRNDWPPEADDVLYTHAATMTPRQLRGMLHRITGLTYTLEAIKSRRLRLGILKRLAEDEVVIADLAQELGVPQARLSRFARCRSLPLRVTDFYTYLPPETQEALRLAFSRPPEPTMSTQAAAAALHLSKGNVNVRIKDGRLKAYRFGAHWKVSVASVEAMRRDMGIHRPLPQTFGTRNERQAMA